MTPDEIRMSLDTETYSKANFSNPVVSSSRSFYNGRPQHELLASDNFGKLRHVADFPLKSDAQFLFRIIESHSNLLGEVDRLTKLLKENEISPR